MSTQQRVSQPRASIAGFIEVWDDKHQRYYYHNIATKETTWTHPKRNNSEASDPHPPTSKKNLTDEQVAEAKRVFEMFASEQDHISFHDMKECLETLLKAKMENDFYEHYVLTEFDTLELNRDVHFDEFSSIYGRIINKSSPPPIKRAVRSSISGGPSSPSSPHSPTSSALSDESCGSPSSATGGGLKKKNRKNASVSSQFKFYCNMQPPAYSYTVFTIMEKFIILQLSHMCGKAATDIMELELQQCEFLWAVMKGDMNTVQRIQSSSTNEQSFIDMVNTTYLPTFRLTAAHLAVASGNLKLVDMLTSESFRMIADRPALNNLSPLHVACAFGIKDACTMLLQRGSYLETVANACPYLVKESLQYKIVHSLWIMKNGAHVAVTPALMACLGGSMDTLQVMVNAGASLSQDMESQKLIADPLSCAISCQSNKLVQYFINTHQYDVNKFDSKGYTPFMLMALCTHGHVSKMVMTALQAHANINLVHAGTGNAAVHMAVMDGHYEFVECLCQVKADTEELFVNLNICNQTTNATPLQLCSKIDNAPLKHDMEQLLKQHGAKEKRQYSEIIKEGYLTKEGNIRKSWKKRWFVLKRDSFRYFKDVHDLKNEKGSIYLMGAEIDEMNGEKKRQYCIALKDKSANRTFYLKAASEEEKTEWCNALKFVIHGNK